VTTQRPPTPAEHAIAREIELNGGVHPDLAWTAWDPNPPRNDIPPLETEFNRLGTPLTRSQLGTLPKIEPLVQGVISTPSTAVLVGGYGLGKSVLAHALGCCIATGKPWLSRGVQQRRVLFVVGEGAYGLDERITAWERAWNAGTRVGEEQATFLVKPASLRDERTWKEVTSYAVDGGYGFVVLDTFSSLAPDADETKDAARIMRQLSDLSSELGGTVLLVHHPGWGDASRTRGGYQFEANADEVLVLTSVAEGSTLVCLTRKKVKDGASGGTQWLNRRPVFGSVILEHAQPDDSEIPVRSRVIAVLTNYGDVGATAAQLLLELAVPETGRSPFYRSLRRLAEEGDIRAEGPRGRTRYFLSTIPTVQQNLDEGQEKPW
jgi:hypothetical protein